MRRVASLRASPFRPGPLPDLQTVRLA